MPAPEMACLGQSLVSEASNAFQDSIALLQLLPWLLLPNP